MVFFVVFLQEKMLSSYQDTEASLECNTASANIKENVTAAVTIRQHAPIKGGE